MVNGREVLRVLLVEDDEEDYLITADMLAGQSRAHFALDWSSDYADAITAIAEQRHDVYLIDFRLGRQTGLDLVREAFATRPRAPVLILTGQSDYEIDLAATALGVTDYLVKQELDPLGLERSIRYAVSHQRSLDELHRSEERYALAVRAANDGLWDWDLAANQIYFSPRWHSMLGYAELSEDEHPSAWFALVHGDDLPALRAAIDAHLEGGTALLESEHRMRHADGSWRWTLTRGLAIRGPDGQARRMAGSLSDITEQRKAEERLKHDALHDGLTELPNRALFMNRVEHAMHRASRQGEPGCAILFCDLDRFKLINDGLGHLIGDRLLIAFAERMMNVVRPGDTVARIGGDEFTILLDGVHRDADAVAAAERVQMALREPFVIEDRELPVTVSIGVCIADQEMPPLEILRNADIAMYAAKRRGGGVSVLFDESMHRRRVERLAHEGDLRCALENGLLDVHYQPIVELATGRVRALEALARWPADWPFVPPIEFIPIAEETGMITGLGRHVTREALKTLRALRDEGVVGDDVSVSVNASARNLDDPDLPDHIAEALSDTGLPASALCIEITESALMKEPDRLAEIVATVCATGVRLHLDDFGTGYSSLAALERFPVESLKIDRSFVSSLSGDSDAIVRSTIALAHNLGMRLIAEGIEDETQLEHLRVLGCECGQGYLFSRPIRAADLRPLLAGWPVPAVSSMN